MSISIAEILKLVVLFVIALRSFDNKGECDVVGTCGLHSALFLRYEVLASMSGPQDSFTQSDILQGCQSAMISSARRNRTHTIDGLKSRGFGHLTAEQLLREDISTSDFPR